MFKQRDGSQPTRHGVPIPCRASRQNYEPVTSIGPCLANFTPLHPIRVARGLYGLGCVWERGEALDRVERARVLCGSVGWMGGVGGVPGKGAEGIWGESPSVVAEQLLGLVWGDSGKVWFTAPRQRSVTMRSGLCDQNHPLGWRQAETHQVLSPQVEKPAARAVSESLKIKTSSGVQADMRAPLPLCATRARMAASTGTPQAILRLLLSHLRSQRRVGGGMNPAHPEPCPEGDVETFSTGC
jgi:hypothetical protein